MRKLDQVIRLIAEVREEVVSGRVRLTADEARQLMELAEQVRNIRNDYIRECPDAARDVARRFNLSDARVSQIRSYWTPPIKKND